MNLSLNTLFPKISVQQRRQLTQYCALLQEWNQRVNLVSRKDVDLLYEHHILPSIIPLRFIEIPADAHILDIGSGGGLPAIPLKIMRPDLQIVMNDSIRKKAIFLKHVIRELQLSGITTVNERIEKVHENFDLTEKIDIITARAVGKIDLLINWGIPYLKSGGHFLLWKGLSDLPDLQASAPPPQFRYQVYEVPREYRKLSVKMEELRWFEIHPHP